MGHRHDGMYRSAMPGRGRSTCGAVKSTVRQAIPTPLFCAVIAQFAHQRETQADGMSLHPLLGQTASTNMQYS